MPGMNLIVLGIILIVMAAAFAVPVLQHGEGRLSDANAVVLAATILSVGLGLLNFAFLIGAMVWNELPAEVYLPSYAWLLGLAPIAAGALGAYVAGLRVTGLQRYVALVVAAALVLAGIPGYFAFVFAALAATASAVLYLGGLVSPQRLFEAIDPRNK